MNAKKEGFSLEGFSLLSFVLWQLSSSKANCNVFKHR